MSIAARELLMALAAGPAISGNDLARQFGVTRAAIWKQVENLRAFGAPIVAQGRQGYRLSAPLDLLDADAIRLSANMHSARKICPLEVHWQIDSTNSALLRRAQAGDTQTAACFAEMQSAGRGRRGRGWHTPLGGGLAFSILHRFNSSMASLAGLSLAVGVGVVRALADLGFAGPGLKWPNDIQIDGSKLAGILIELGGDALGPCHAVIGIGLNVRLDAHSDDHINQPWTDLTSLSDGPLPPRNQIAANVLCRVLDVLDEFASHGFPSFASEYSRYDVLHGRPISIFDGRERRAAVAAGVDQVGNLRACAADGEFLVDSGEVSVRATDGASA
ncbi:MAG TPA: biotin--[acetyl-CoA-carboxylase] ligase [Dokdonella sp.]|uniref:biotin--[acetyl-CoA-carboxylase] ligase n=1 Tax=Dokdonella sp. TaxID=2291710 RepID=UPI002D7EFFA3|nr:biotin--[acetyl-CoA-carboxylase] ligase [Dokdonella sp.]HET9031630.1 biotin--[acetyl-CoA-carboxylase] ligase [Dokdonella sp.]